MFDNARRAMDFYANTPNPESHVVVGRNQNHIHKEVKQLNSLLKNKEYLKQLKEYI